MRIKTMAALAAAGLFTCGTAWAGPNLDKPTPVKAGDENINVDVGHAAPFVIDWDGDGKRDLLVGQMGKGQMRIYKNTGSDKAPTFKDFQVFKVGESEGTVPTG